MSHQNDFLNSPKCDITHIADEIPGIVFQILQAPDGMISFPFFSVAAQQLLGLGKKEMEEAKNGLVNFIVKEDFTRWLSVLKKHARSLSSFSEEIRVIGKDGSIIQLSGISKPLPIADKNILWNTVLFDIMPYLLSSLFLRITRMQATIPVRQTRIPPPIATSSQGTPLFGASSVFSAPQISQT